MVIKIIGYRECSLFGMAGDILFRNRVLNALRGWKSVFDQTSAVGTAHTIDYPEGSGYAVYNSFCVYRTSFR